MDVTLEIEFLRDHIFLQNIQNSKSAEPRSSSNLDWKKLINLAKANGLSLTTYKYVARYIDPLCLPPGYFSLLSLENACNNDFVDTLEYIHNIFTDDINFLFLKFEKYPDMGKDIDIYVGDDLEKILSLLAKKGYKRKLSRYNKLFNRYLLINDYRNMHPIDLYPSFSRFRERWITSTLFLKKRRKIKINNIEIYTTSLEDSVMINSVSSIYLNHYLNLSSLFVIYRSVIDDNFDRKYFVNLVKDAGLSLSMYYVLSILRQFTGNRDLSYLIECFQPKRLFQKIVIRELGMKSFPIHISLRIILLFYLYKIFTDTLNGRLICGLSLLTPLFASSLARFINKKRG